MHRGRALALLTMPALLAGPATITGCAGRGDAEPEPPTGGEALVLRLGELPGLLPPGAPQLHRPAFLCSVTAG